VTKAVAQPSACFCRKGCSQAPETQKGGEGAHSGAQRRRKRGDVMTQKMEKKKEGDPSLSKRKRRGSVRGEEFHQERAGKKEADWTLGEKISSLQLWHFGKRYMAEQNLIYYPASARRAGRERGNSS